MDDKDKTALLVEWLQKHDTIGVFPLNDVGASSLFSNVFKCKHRFNSTAGEWAVYDGRRWEFDRGGLAARADAKALWIALRQYAAGLRDVGEDQMKAFDKFVGNWSSNRYRNTVINDARDNFYISNEDFDADDFTLNVSNGTLRLNEGKVQFSQHDANDLLSKIAETEYKPDATCGRWEQFMCEIMLDDESKIDYLQKLCGLALTGDTSLEKMWFLFGSTTRNGKSCFVETLCRMLGDYALTMKPESLAVRQYNDGRTASGDIARLAGARLVVCSEPPKRMPLDTSLLKSLIGRDTITARHLHQSEFQFVPKFKLVCNTNYLPLVNDTTVFKSDRIQVVSFDRHFGETEQDRRLKDKLQEPSELSGILNWCIEGWRKYYTEGLEPPESVRVSTGEYEASSDKMQCFINDTLVEASGWNLSVKEVYELYEKWCEDNGYHVENKGNFTAEIKSKGIYKDRGMVGGKQVRNIVVGYTIRDDTEFVEVDDKTEIPFDL